ncbi:hypothetical protein ACLMJK_002084 [Lecanora helva]
MLLLVQITADIDLHRVEAVHPLNMLQIPTLHQIVVDRGVQAIGEEMGVAIGPDQDLLHPGHIPLHEIRVSPLPVRREPSPYRRPRSPLPAKQERYDRRGYSPPRNGRPTYPSDSKYRGRERSLSPRRSQHVSRMASPVSSRRSSPHVHPDRIANTVSDQQSSAYRSSRAPDPRDLGYNDRSTPRRAYSPVPHSPPREPVTYRTRSPPPRDRNEYSNGTAAAKWADPHAGKSQPSSYRDNEPRPPPSGPAYRGSYVRDTPPEAPSTAPISMSAHNRPDSASLLSAPTRPRGGPSFADRGSRDHPYGGPPPYRGGRAPPASSFHGPPPRQQNESRPPPDHTSYGPRSSYHGPPPSHEAPYRAPPPFRSNNSSSTTYPRTQRFNHLASSPSIKEGGEALPSLVDPAARKRLAELEEGRKKLMDQIEEKQREKRRNLREWETRERESRRDGLRSEMAEEALEAMSGDGPGTGTAF